MPAKATTRTKKPTAKRKPAAKRKPPAKKQMAKKVTLLSGDNPQIAKGDGNAPVKAYIAAIPPGWKRDIAKRIDAIVEATVPNVAKAVKWNSPFYGLEGNGWFLSFHMFDRYVKVTFFRGTSLKPVPPDPSKHPEVRYANIHEGALEEAQLASWVKQAASLPGEKL